MNETQATKEIEALHAFFEDWFGGLIKAEEAVFQERFASRFHDDCELIQPSGATLSREVFFKAVLDSHDSSPDFRIAIRNVRVRFVLPGGYTLVTYEEWQRNAVNSTPSDNARAASVLFSESNSAQPHWMHIHETWLPAAQTPAERFDF